MKIAMKKRKTLTKKRKTHKRFVIKSKSRLGIKHRLRTKSKSQCHKTIKKKYTRKKGGYNLCKKAHNIKPYAKKTIEWFKNFDEQLRKDVLCKTNSSSLNSYLEPSRKYNTSKTGRPWKTTSKNGYRGCDGIKDHKPSIYSPIDWLNGFKKKSS